MNKRELAMLLNGRQYRSEITKAEERLAETHGLIVIFGYSDDNCEFRGALNDEVGCYNGGMILFDKNRVLPEHDNCECDFCGYEEARESCAGLTAVWDREGYSWTYTTPIPHETFEIMEGEDKYCRGIVIDRKDLP